MPVSIEESEKAIEEFKGLYPVDTVLFATVTPTYNSGLYKFGMGQNTFEPSGQYRPYNFIYKNAEYDGVIFIYPNENRDVDEVFNALRHETLGHYGLNTFQKGEKQEILRQIYRATFNDKEISAYWDKVNKIPEYARGSKLLRAEEIFAHLAEKIEPNLHLNNPSVKANFDKTWKEVFVDKSRDLNFEDMSNISLEVAQSIHEKTREQLYFPNLDRSPFPPMRDSEKQKDKEPALCL